MMSRTAITAIIALTLCLYMRVEGSVTTVRTASELSRAVETAKPGDEILVADGSYTDWDVELKGAGAVDNPIVVRPQSTNGVTLSGKCHFLMTGASVTVQNIQFTDCALETSIFEMQNAVGCRVTRCTFQRCEGRRSVVAFQRGSSNNRVDHCRFVQIAGRSVQVRIHEDIREFGIPEGNRIDHNLFQDIPPLGGNGRETIQVGQDQRTYGDVASRTLVEHNLFVRCDGEAEIISNKSSHNIYRRNVFRDCAGELVMRGGSWCVIEDNRFESCTGGIRLSGTHHRVTDNVVLNSRSTGIRLLYGMSEERGGHYQAVSRCFIAHNIVMDAGEVGILIGDGRGQDSGSLGVKSIAPFQNMIMQNIVVGKTGDLLQVVDAPGNQVVENLLYPIETAVVSSPGNRPIFREPEFMNAAAGDYRLVTGSPKVTDGAQKPDVLYPAPVGAAAVPFEYGPE